MSIWESMGFIRWPLAFSLLWVVLLSIWSATQLFGWNASPTLRTRAWLNAIPFWGGFAVIVGALGTVVGFIITAQSIEAAGEISTPLAWGGIKVSLLTSGGGILIMAIAALSWFVLSMRWNLLRADEEPEA